MSDKPENSKHEGGEKDYWGSVYTAKSDRANDKHGWDERKNDWLSDERDRSSGGMKESPYASRIGSGQSSAAAVNNGELDNARPFDSASSVRASAQQSQPSVQSPDRSSHPFGNNTPLVVAGIGAVILLLTAAIYTITGSRSGMSNAAMMNATNSPVADVSTSAFVNTRELNLRTNPGSEYASVTKLPHGTEVIRLGVGQSADGGSWARIRSGSFEGWVNQKLLSDVKPMPLEEVQSKAGSSGISFRDTTVSLGSVNGVQIVGLTVKQAEQTLGWRLVGNGDENEGCSYLKPEGTGQEISFMVIDGRIARINIDSAPVSYEGGIRIGDSEAKVKSLFGNRLKVEPHAYDEAGKYLSFTQGKFGVVFETDGRQVIGIRSGRKPEFEYIEGCS